MPRKQKKYHYIYKTTNILNNKFYIGMHSTDNLDDGYIGSGTRLWSSINKHGKENHVCEILEYLPNRKVLRIRELELVNKDLLDEELCMNLALGGCGSDTWEFVNKKLSHEHRVETGRKGGNVHKERMLNDVEYYKKVIASSTQNIVQAHKDGKIKYDTFTGKTHSEETKRKMSAAKKGKYSGKNNSQYGTCWVSSVGENITKKINKSELQEHLKCGWARGRNKNNSE